MSAGAPSNAGAENLRLELGMAAAAAERRNRPRWLVYVSVLIALGASAYAYTGFSARVAAQKKLGEAGSRANDIARVVGDINRLKADDAARGLEPDPRIAFRLEAAANSLGLKLVGQITDSGGDSPVSGMMQQKRYSVKIGSEDPAVLFRWLSAVLGSSDIRGLELSRLRINPAPPHNYSADIEFSRWEKRGK